MWRIFIPLIFIVITAIGCGEGERAVSEPAYLIYYPPYLYPDRLWIAFSDEVTSVTLGSRPASEILYDERGKCWWAVWKFENEQEIIDQGLRKDWLLILWVEWTDAEGRKGERGIVLSIPCCTPRVERTDPPNMSVVDADKYNKNGIVIEFSDLDIQKGITFILRNSKGEILNWGITWLSRTKAVLKPKKGMELEPGELYTLTVKNFCSTGLVGEETRITFATKALHHESWRSVP